jgi:hypothetical protein
MEFSEISELTRVLRSGSYNHEYFDQDFSPCKMINYNFSLEGELVSSPPSSIFMDVDHSLSDDYDEKIEFGPEKTLETSDAELKVEKNENFKNEYYESLHKTSSLALSLNEQNEDKNKGEIPEQNKNLIELTIYLFGTSDTLIVKVPSNVTIDQLLVKVIDTYMKNDINKIKPLPKGPVPEAYQIWMIEEDDLFPDTDFIIEKTIRVIDLDTQKLAFCAISGTSYNKTSLVYENTNLHEGIPLKIYFEETWLIIGAERYLLLKEVLGIIETKFPRLGYMNPNEYDFYIEVDLENTIDKEECIVSMDLPVSSLTTYDLKLYKKIYVDSPIKAESIKKKTNSIEEDVIYDPLIFHMSSSQACVYKEYEVIKINRKGKKQKRILGINQLTLFNMTLAQSKSKLKEKVVANGCHLTKKIVSMFKSITQHPEIPMYCIHDIRQDHQNLSRFYIDYTEAGFKKRKFYETQKSSITAEIIAKVTKLMSLVSL